MAADKRGDVARVVMLVALTAVASWGISWGFDPSRAGEPSAIEGLGAAYALLAACALVWAFHTSQLKKWLLPRFGDLSIGFFSALVLFGLAFGFVKLITMHHSPRAAWMAHLYLQIGDPRPLRLHQAWVGVGVAIAAFLEEVVWRGWAKSMLDDLVGLRVGWIAAAVLYALAHLPTLWALGDTSVGPNPMVVIAALGAGLVWSGMTRVFGRLWPAVICHALFDWAVLMMFRLWGPSV
ncbi:MAG TPA: type II CAAX endopeptidase family protein [Polyangiaceae bacterium]